MISEEAKPIKEIMAEAKAAEDAQQFDIAERLYQNVLQQDSLNEHAFSRLMIIYRKQKEKKKELDLIDDAISAYQQFYKAKQHRTKTITTISNKLNKAFGLTDRKGNALYLPEPIATWQKRKESLEKRKKKK